MSLTRWPRQNWKGILGGIIQSVVNVFGSLIAFSDEVSKAVGIAFSPAFFLALVIVDFLGLGLIAWNGQAKATTRRLFGEPHIVSNGVREYETRYDLPRLNAVFEQSKKRILILGRALTYVSIYEMQLVREATKRGVDVAIYFLYPDSKLAESDTLNPSTPNFKQYIKLGLEAAQNAKNDFPEEYRKHFRIFTYDPQAEPPGTYIIYDPDISTKTTDRDTDPYIKGGWTQAERLHIEQPVKGRDISHAGSRISTWKDNKKFIQSQLQEFNNCLRNVTEV